MIKHITLPFILVLFLTQCQPKKKAPKHKVNRESYYKGNTVYTNNCEGCHKKNGEGFKDLYPPLAQSDFLLNNPNQALRFIYYGTNDSITVNGKHYNFKMPDNKHLNREEITDVMNYISNSWGNNSPHYDVKTINEILK